MEEENFYLNVDVLGTGTGYLCYNIYETSGTSIDEGPLSSNILGPFNSNIWLEIKLCSTPVCTCSTPTCFKLIYIPKPDCENLDFRNQQSSKGAHKLADQLIQFTNPIYNQEIFLRSSLSDILINLGVTYHLYATKLLLVSRY